MRIDLLTREYPPYVYGGAGIHVEALAKYLRQYYDVRVHCLGASDPGSDATVSWHEPPPHLADPALQALAADVSMVQGVRGAALVHSHTWYTNFAGHTAKILYDMPHVITTHSLEPLRPWKQAQLGSGYRLSSYLERSALTAADLVIAVSHAMAEDVTRVYPSIDPSRIAVVHNGVDASEFHPDHGTDALESTGVRLDHPIVVCIARITPQKGLGHLLRASQYFASGTQLVVVAQHADSPAHQQQFQRALDGLHKNGVNAIWLSDTVERRTIIQLLTHATTLVCPSIYEPQGIVNLEAMACGTAVIGTATGGIPEVVVDGETGLLIPFKPAADGTVGPAEPAVFAKEIAARVNHLLDNPGIADAMGAAGRHRALAEFSWQSAADRVAELYNVVSR